MSQVSAEFIPTRIAILTVSDRRGEEDDTSGHWLREAAHDAGHKIVDKAIVKENRYAIRAQVSQWIASDEVQVVLITGGTGFTTGDQVPEALSPLFDREVEGFGEVMTLPRINARAFPAASRKPFISASSRLAQAIPICTNATRRTSP